ncbi:MULTISPECIES: NAD-dependent epimerase/dehydratase family protein [Pseudomonadati]|uniref:GDP-L-fucose synthase n=1 Tax=Rosistilla oblonga TaxID=2527990 RepID=A0A518IQY7_9BACT|nr:NAD-dependent epimerase/dehydratase family protein [Rosistilla oblonga]QDV55502.1 GDP-L-fucose synthase [Rosistilla oblonga]
MKNVIILGATGFIGKSLCNALRSRFGNDCNMIPVGTSTVDLANRTSTFDWFESKHWKFDCDHIIHLSALYRAGDWPVRHPATQFFVNMSMNVNVLEAWKRFFPAAKMTSILSYCIYPSHDQPHDESEVYGTEPEDYLFAYALTKKSQLIGQRAYATEHGLTSTSVVLPTVYGPGDSFAEDSHVMGALIGKFVRAKLSNQASVEVWGSGNQEREFLFVEDAADGIIEAAMRSEVPIVNLGCGRAYRISDVVDTIVDVVGYRGQIVNNENRFTGVSKRVMDVSLAKAELNWTAATSLRQGVERTVRAYYEELSPQQRAA